MSSTAEELTVIAPEVTAPSTNGSSQERPLKDPYENKGRIPHQEQLLVRFAQQFFNDVKISGIGRIYEAGTVPAEEMDRLLRSIGEHIVDRGLRTSPNTVPDFPLKWPVTDSKLVPNPRYVQGDPEDSALIPEHILYFQNLRSPEYILRSSMAPFLEGYEVAATIDVKNLAGANAVDEEKHIFGDLLLIDIMNAVHHATGLQLYGAGKHLYPIRMRGDALDLRVPKGTTVDIDAIRDAIKKKSGLFKEGDEVRFLPANVSIEDTSAAFEEKEVTASAIQLSERITAFREDHPDIGATLSKIMYAGGEKDPEVEGRLTYEESLRLMNIIDRTYYNPLLQEEAEALSEELGVNIHVFSDLVDLVKHLQANGVEGEEKKKFHLIKMDTPGIVKLLNALYGDKAGDLFLKKMFRRSIEGTPKEIPDINFVQKGADPYIAIDGRFDITKVMNSIRENMGRDGYSPENGRKFPVIPGLTAVSLDIIPGDIINYNIVEENQRAIFAGVEQLNSVMWSENMHQFKEFYTALPEDASDEWLFLADFFNPHTKRGALHIKKLADLKGASINLTEFYTNENGNYSFVRSKMQDYKDTVLPLLKKSDI